MYCIHCGAKLVPGIHLCNSCGITIKDMADTINQLSWEAAKVDPANKDKSGMFPKKFTITRFKGLNSNPYKFFINGQDMGKIKLNKTLIFDIYSDDLEIDIRNMYMVGVHQKLRIKVTSKTPAIAFSTKYKGVVESRVAGVEVLEIDNAWDGLKL